MTLFEYFISAISVLLLLAAIYTVRSLRVIGNKISTVHQAVKKSEQNLGSQIQDLIGDIHALRTITQFENSRELSRAKFVLSLTSHPDRFDALEQLIPSIEAQILKPSEIHLNIAREDMAKLSPSLRAALKRAKVRVFDVANFGPGKKLIPTLSRTKLPIIVIDDDLVLPNDLTLQLMALHLEYPSEIIASRTHRITSDENGLAKKFAQWQLEYHGEISTEPRLLATSGAGTLFPFGSLHPDVTDEKSYRDLAFHTDDLWWYFHARRIGVNVRRIPGRRSLTFIEGSQEAGLWVNGNQERNDKNFAALSARYGNPLDKSKLH